MKFVDRLLHAASYALAFVAGVGTFGTMVLVAADVTLRAFGGGVPGTLYIVGYYLMIMVAFLPLARVEGSDGMISVDILFAAATRIGQRVISLFVALLSTAIYAAVAYSSWFEAAQKFESGAYIQTLDYNLPIWPAYFFIPISFGLAALVALLRLVQMAGGGPVPGQTAILPASARDELGLDDGSGGASGGGR